MFDLKRKIKKFVACGLVIGSLMGQKVMADYPSIIGALDGFHVGSKISLTTDKDKELAKIASDSKKLKRIFKNYEPAEPYATWVKIGTSGNKNFYALVFGCRNIEKDGTYVSYFSSVSNEKAGELVCVRGKNRHSSDENYGYTMFENPIAIANQGCIIVPNPFIVHESENRKGEAMSVYFETEPLKWSECPFYAGSRDEFMDGHHFIVTELSEDEKTEKVVEWPEEIVEFARLKKENETQKDNPSDVNETDKKALSGDGKEINENNGGKTSDRSTVGTKEKCLLLASASSLFILGYSSSDNNTIFPLGG